MRKKLLLINPASRLREGFNNDKSTCFQPIGLGIVAALTPDNWDVELIDENFEEFSYQEADLVGFTGFTSNMPRAYQIASVYRQKGITTVMGGIHATMYTAEVMQYVDVVVTRDAEGAWPQVIADFESGSLKKLYDGGNVEVDKISQVRRDIFKHPYVYDLVQTSRGCPMGCEFCSVTHMCGMKYRERNVEDVLDELSKTNRPLLFFIDDNLVNNRKGADQRAISLFKGMVSRGIKKHWLAQVAVSIADNEEVLHWAHKAGCRLFLMGIEAENPKALKAVRKNLNLKRGTDTYESTFAKIHKHGIGILGAMIFGMESDTKQDLLARRNFISSSSIDCYQCTVLTPLPGTVLFDRMKQNNMIEKTDYPKDWEDYHGMKAVINIPALNHTELESTMRDVWLSLYNKEALRRKMFKTLWKTKSFEAAYWTYSSNHNYARMFLGEIIKHDPEGVDKNMEWKNRKRSLYLKITDLIVLLIYKFKWEKLVSRYNKIS